MESATDEFFDEDDVTVEDIFFGLFKDKGSKGLLTEIHDLIVNKGVLPVRLVVSDEGIPMKLSKPEGELQFITLLNILRGDLGYGNAPSDDSIKSLIDTVSKTAEELEGAGPVLNVNLRSTDVGLVDFARPGNRSGNNNYGR